MVVLPEDDFQGYMESLQQQDAEEQRIKEMLERHEIWRQTTWGGWVVRQLQALAKHFAPFFEAVADSVSGDPNTPAQRMILILIRILTISGYIAAVYAVARIVSMFLGQEIVIEEVIVVEDEEAENQTDADITQPENSDRRRSRRGKKEQ